MAESEGVVTEDEYTAQEEMLSAYSALIVLVLQLTLTIVHGTRFYSDLCTSDRKVLNYRRTKPAISPRYKRTATLTFFCVCCFTLLLTAEVIQFNFTMGSCEDMFAFQLLDKVGYFGAKCSLYLTFVLRLDEVYGSSAHGYKIRNLQCIGATIIILSVAMFVLLQIFTWFWPIYVADTDDEFPFFCQIITQETQLLIIGGLMALTDFTACITAMVAFIRPLNKVIKAASLATAHIRKETHEKKFRKMIYTGTKYKILVIVSATSTLFWLVLVSLGFVSVATIVGQFDFWLNPLCLVLMTPYYPSDQYYERLCFLCLFCCDKSGVSYRSTASDTHVGDQKERESTKETVASSTVHTTTVHTTSTVDTDVGLQVKLERVQSETEVESNVANAEDQYSEMA